MADSTIEQFARRSKGGFPRDKNSADGALVTTKVRNYTPNPWGLFDMHGKAADWTRTIYQSYPYDLNDGRAAIIENGRKVIRGGSWYDRPKRCTSAFR